MRDDLTELLVRNIQELMVRRGLNPHELAARAGLNPTGVYDIISGKSRSPKLENVAKIADALGTPVTTLLEEPRDHEMRSDVIDALPRLEPSEDLLSTTQDAATEPRHADADAVVELEGRTFRDAFLDHLDQHGTTLTDLVETTGVSRDILNKLKARPGSSTNVEAGLKIAEFYGKTLNDFMGAATPPPVLARDEDEDRLVEMFRRLRQDEKAAVLKDVRGRFPF